MAQEIFKRVEEKYVLTRAQYTDLMRMLRGRLIPEVYGDHTIRNIYYDTPDFALVRRSIEGPVYKEKFRVRSYGRPDRDATVYLELKKKYRGVVYKRRTDMRLWEAMRYLAAPAQRPAESQILREIDYFRGMHLPLLPRVFLAYERAAFTAADDPELRITFDENIRARATDVCLNGADGGERLFAQSNVLMEIKIPGAIPLWLNHMLTELEIYSRGFSKYGAYYEQILFPNLRQERLEILHA